MSDYWILCVDDEPRVLSGLELQLGFEYEVRTAEGGAEGLALLAEHQNCAVIISDMRMPEMSGAEFLQASREICEDSTRILLTGYSDIDDAVSAVNDGGIFRFLTKPSKPETVLRAVEEGAGLWELKRSERILLEQTLHGAANALVETLELSAPSVFPGIRRIESASRHAADRLGINPIWEVGLAGLLHRIGWIAVPPDIVERHLAGTPLSPAEADMFASTSATSVRLINHIPRLGGVAEIMTAMATIDSAQASVSQVDAPSVVSASSELVRQIGLGLSGSQALAQLAERFPTDVVQALRSWEGMAPTAARREVTVYQIAEGMMIEEDVVSVDGSLLVRAGSSATSTIVERLHNFAETQGVQEPIMVSFPS